MALPPLPTFEEHMKAREEYLKMSHQSDSLDKWNKESREPEQLELPLPGIRRPRLVLLAGKMHSGKSYVAGHLIANHGFVKRSLAEALKQDIFNMGFSYADIAGKPSWMRALMQAYGQARRAVNPDCWLLAWANSMYMGMEGPDIVVDDVRFPNEVKWLYDWATDNAYDFYFVRLIRLGYDRSVIPGSEDESETALDNWSAASVGIKAHSIAAVSGDTNLLTSSIDKILRDGVR